MKQEGGYWDFKREWHNSNDKLLHDIICMANNLNSQEAYLIIGVDEDNDFSVCDIKSDANRKTTQNMVDFLRDKKFAGGIRPTVTVESIDICDALIDVIVIHFDRHTPYYLSERYQSVNANNIYTRVQDTNTPIDKTADINHVELLWKRRFGIDASIMERFSILLDQREQWECSWGNRTPAYHKGFPEFRIEEDIDNAIDYAWLPQSVFYATPQTRVTPMKLLYHNTVVFETEMISLDGGAGIKIPVFCKERLEIFVEELSSRAGLCYCYFVQDELSGKLLQLIANDYINDLHFGETLCFLTFCDEAEHLSFRDFAVKHHRKIIPHFAEFIDNHPYKNKIDKCKSEYNGILALIISSKLYDEWNYCRDDYIDYE
jgi:hypothetical protein